MTYNNLRDPECCRALDLFDFDRDDEPDPDTLYWTGTIRKSCLVATKCTRLMALVGMTYTRPEILCVIEELLQSAGPDYINALNSIGMSALFIATLGIGIRSTLCTVKLLLKYGAIIMGESEIRSGLSDDIISRADAYHYWNIFVLFGGQLNLGDIDVECFKLLLNSLSPSFAKTMLHNSRHHMPVVKLIVRCAAITGDTRLVELILPYINPNDCIETSCWSHYSDFICGVPHEDFKLATIAKVYSSPDLCMSRIIKVFKLLTERDGVTTLSTGSCYALLTACETSILTALIHSRLLINQLSYMLYTIDKRPYDKHIIVREIVATGHDINSKVYGTTPLDNLLKAGRLDCAQLLLESGAAIKPDTLRLAVSYKINLSVVSVILDMSAQQPIDGKIATLEFLSRRIETPGVIDCMQLILDRVKSQRRNEHAE